MDELTIRGKLIVIEGGDGSGKTDQVGMLLSRLEQLNYRVKVWDFPQYGTSYFGKMAGRMLRGDFGELKTVHPLLAAALFALDRLSVKDEMLEFLGKGGVGICNRYTDSNLAHGAAKFADLEARRAYIDEVESLEFGELGLPKPDLSLYLAADARLSRRLVLTKGEREYLGRTVGLDQAERDIDHQTGAREVYEYLCRTRPRFVRVECMGSSGEIDTREMIHGKIWEELSRRFVV